MVTDSAMRPEAASAWLAPTAVSPCKIMKKELAKPTKAESRPADMA
jgi:hypothetical protein